MLSCTKIDCATIIVHKSGNVTLTPSEKPNTFNHLNKRLIIFYDHTNILNKFIVNDQGLFFQWKVGKANNSKVFTVILISEQI